MPPKPRKPPPRRPDPRKRNLLIAGAGAALVVAILVVVSVVVAGGGDSGTTTTSGAASSALFDGIPQNGTELGAKNAPVTFIQFEDLQCPICRDYQQEGFPGVVDEYVKPGKVKLRFVGMHFLGPDSTKALEYTLAAGEQGKLWQFADSLYANQGAENSGWVTDSLLETIAGDLGLDYAKLQTDASSPVVQQQMQSMAAEATQRQVPGTPTFYVQVGDGEPYQVHPSSFAVEQFRTILDDALAG